jgi:hypothetical protein
VGYDIYPFAALSRGLLGRQDQRVYGVHYFDKIMHPEIKLFWASVLFDEGPSSPTITAFLNAALDDGKLSKTIVEIVGPEFQSFQKRVRDASLASKTP